MILRTTENVVKNIMLDVYDRSGCSNRVELALLLFRDAETGMYEEETLDRELSPLHALTRGIETFALVELAGTRAAASTE